MELSVFLGRRQGVGGADRVNQLQILKVIAFKIIDFISQFEDELVKIWNKPKFVKNSNYVITIDRITDKKLVEKIKKHKNYPKQVKEWEELGIDQNNPKAPIDTKYFKDLELKILGQFEDLDKSLDGWLIKSENYQALNTIFKKFKSRINCVYIDPPYNADGAEILYINNFRSSSWLSLLENRLRFVKEYFAHGNKALVVAVDDFEMARAVQLLKENFDEYDVNPIIINHHPQGSPKANISRTHEYALLITPKDSDFVRVLRKKEKSDERSFMRSGTGENNYRYGRPNSFYALLIDPKNNNIKGIEEPPVGNKYPTDQSDSGLIRIYPIDGSSQERVWRKSYKSAVRALKDGRIFCHHTGKKFNIYEKVSIERVKPTSNWFESKYNAGTHGTTLLSDLFGRSDLFSYPKSIHAEQDIIDAIVHEIDNAIILDFFAGSGTTAHAIMNLNRDNETKHKYILVEMAGYFDRVILPRIKKLCFSDKWENGKAQDGGQGISQFVKYYELEQYEEALANCKYEDSDLFNSPSKTPYQEYVFMKDEKMLNALEIDYEKEKVKVDLTKLYPSIDIAETLSNLTGKWIKKVSNTEVEFEDGTKINTKNLDYKLIKPLIWWE